MQQQIASQCSESFNIPIRPTIKVISRPQGKLVFIFIPEADAHEKPVFIKSKGINDGAFRRIGSTDQVCRREDLDLIYHFRLKQKFEASQLEEASFEDFDPIAIQTYRNKRKEIKVDASELNYNNEDLLRALKAISTEKGAAYPTVAGILLFGKPSSLKRIFPMRNHIDYLLIEGREWVSDPDRRFTALEMNQSLITGIPYLLNQIMNHIPQIFALEADKLHRKDNPLIPRAVIREALVNATMHRDYLISSPTQIIKYANRIEFRNAGYSLKPKDQLALPGSLQRNDIIADVFRDIHYAETKGTGISMMREEMKKANLTVPLIESNRSANLFVLTLLPHHLVTKQDIRWLSHFKSLNLSDEEARTLIIMREMGAMTNADYRTIHSVDTLTASTHLRKLRDHGLLEQKGGGSGTYYLPSRKLLAADANFLIEESLVSAEKSPKNIEVEISTIGKRTSPDLVKQTIKKLCLTKPYKAHELAILLNRATRHIRDRYLTPMVESGDLELEFPDNPAHPFQTYKAKS